MAHLRKQNQTAHPLQFLMVLTSDHLTGATGKTPAVKLSKNGATGAAPAGAITEIDATNNPGWYQVAGNATDSNTLGPLILSATAALCDPTDGDFQVVAFDPDDAVRIGLTALPNVTANASGGLPTIDASLRVSANVTAIGGTATTYDANNLLNVNVKDWNGTATTLMPLTDKAGYSLSGSQTFNTTGNLSGSVGSVTGAVGSVTGSVGSVVSGVTVTTNNDKGGYTVTTVSDKTGYSLAASQTFNTTGNITGNLSGSVGNVTGAVGSVTGTVGAALSVTGTVGAALSVTGAVGSVAGNVVGSVGSVATGVTVTTNNDKGGYTVTTVSDKTGYSLAASQTFNTTGNLSGSVGSVTGAVGSVTGTVGAALSVSGTVGAAASVTAPITVGTNNDKAGYSLSASQTFSMSGNISGNVTGSVGSVAGAVGSIASGGITSASFAAGSLPAASGIKKNTALAGFEFVMTDSTTHAPKTAVTVTATRSLDGAAFGACTNAVAELSNGVYTINLAAADLNANVVTFRFTGTASDDLLVTVITQP